MKPLSLAVVILTLSVGAAFAQSVRIATEGAYPPFNFINDAGEVDGFERELGDVLCGIAGLTCEWVTDDWDAILPDLQAGKFEAVLSAVTITDKRAQLIDFTQAYVPPAASAYLAGRPDADLTTGVIAAQKGSIQAGYVTGTGAKLAEFATADDALAALRDGTADAVLADKQYLAPIAAASQGALVFVGPDVALGGGIGMGLRKGDAGLQGKFDAAIGAMKCDGSLEAMIVKWFGDGATGFGAAGRSGC